MKIKKGRKFRVEHNKKLLIVIFILSVLFISLLIIVPMLRVGEEGEGDVVEKEKIIGDNECIEDSDCVKELCCHSATCVAVSKVPDCENILCTMDCVPGTLDCGQGSCKCIDGKCGEMFG